MNNSVSGIEAEGPAVPRRILVAEDVELNRAILEAMLSQHGHSITFAEDGAIAVERASQQPFDVILMDVQMPVMDGVEATRTIRNGSGPNRNVPIFALTANARDERGRCLEAGMNECLSKPLGWAELSQALARGLSAIQPAFDHSGASAPAAFFIPDVYAGVRACVPRDRLLVHLETFDLELTMLVTPEIVDLRRTAHRIVSQAGMLGFAKMSELSMEVEDAADDGALDQTLVRRVREGAAEVQRHLVLLKSEL